MKSSSESEMSKKSTRQLRCKQVLAASRRCNSESSALDREDIEVTWKRLERMLYIFNKNASLSVTIKDEFKLGKNLVCEKSDDAECLVESINSEITKNRQMKEGGFIEEEEEEESGRSVFDRIMIIRNMLQKVTTFCLHLQSGRSSFFIKYQIHNYT